VTAHEPNRRSPAPVDHGAIRARVEQALRRFLAGQRAELVGIDPVLAEVSAAIEDFVLGGGKRLRPSFAYWGFIGAGGQDSTALMTALAALELVQASALMHDDLIDASDTRRGVPSIHRRFAAHHTRSGWPGPGEPFGTASAILLGDLCLVWSDEMLGGSGFDPTALARARSVFDRMRTEVTVGQYLDVHAQFSGDCSVDRASKVARYKSAKYTVERPLLFGAALAGADDVLAKVLSGYGMPLGEAFQLRDDVLGVFGDPATTGKPAGDDLREGKRTYLVAAALELADEGEKAVLYNGLGDARLSHGQVAEVREVIVSTGALARTEARIAELTAAALASLRSARLVEPAGRALTELAGAATRREV
jgi:geranylgeranyl diphosphate synthase type I